MAESRPGGPSAEASAARLDVIHHALSCDPNFNRYAIVWMLGPTLDATHMATEVLRLTPWGSKFVEERRDDLRRFLAHHYVPRDGRFQTHVHGDRSQPGGVFAAHAGIGVIKAILGLPPGRPIGEDRYRKCIRDLDTAPGMDPVDGLVELLHRSADSSPVPGTFVDHPETQPIPTVTSLQTGFSLLWNLFGADEAPQKLFEIVDREAATYFLRGCLKRSPVSDFDIAGFTIHPAVEELCVNTTYFALRLIDRLDLGDEILDDESRHDILVFLRNLAFQERGFRSTLREAPSLNATHFGLLALKILQRDTGFDFETFRRHAAPKIERFIADCTWTTGGAAFSENKQRYADNCVASRYAARILKILEKDSDGEGRDSIFDALLRFCADRFDEESGGFRAYPEGRIAMPASGAVQWVTGEIERRNRRLLDERDWTVERDPLEEIHQHLDTLFDELDALLLRQEEDGQGNEKLQDSIDEISAAIERLKVEEASTWRRQFEASLPFALDHGEQELLEAKEYLAKVRASSHASASG